MKCLYFSPPLTQPFLCLPPDGIICYSVEWLTCWALADQYCQFI